MSVQSFKVDNVNHPPHYLSKNIKCECNKVIECIDVTRHFNFNLGNALKYIWRADHKEKPIEDLKKAVWYLNDEIKQREIKAYGFDEAIIFDNVSTQEKVNVCVRCYLGFVHIDDYESHIQRCAM